MFLSAPRSFAGSSVLKQFPVDNWTQLTVVDICYRMIIQKLKLWKFKLSIVFSERKWEILKQIMNYRRYMGGSWSKRRSFRYLCWNNSKIFPLLCNDKTTHPLLPYCSYKYFCQNRWNDERSINPNKEVRNKIISSKWKTVHLNVIIIKKSE